MIRNIARTTLLILVLIPIMGFKLMPIEYIRAKVKIDHILVLPVQTVISDIFNNNESELNDSLSNATFETTTTLLKTYFPDTVSHEYFYPDSVQQSIINNAIVTIVGKVKTNQKAKSFKIPDSLIKVFEKSKTNYIFCISNVGFIRSYENMRKKYNEGQALQYVSPLQGLITNLPIIPLGFTPYKSSAIMAAFIIDLKNKNLLYFKRDIWPDRNPTEEIVIKSQLKDLINSYFM